MFFRFAFERNRLRDLLQELRRVKKERENSFSPITRRPQNEEGRQAPGRSVKHLFVLARSGHQKPRPHGQATEFSWFVAPP